MGLFFEEKKNKKRERKKRRITSEGKVVGRLIDWAGKGFVGSRERKRAFFFLVKGSELYCTASAMRSYNQLQNYLGPSFSNILGPSSCHSCLLIHMLSLSAIWSLLEI